MTATITTITKRSEFVRLNRARKVMTDYFILRCGCAAGAGVEVGYTVTTKCGNAVTRNRIKRRLRALVRELAPELACEGMAYNFIARADAKPSAADVEYSLLREAMRAALMRAAS